MRRRRLYVFALLGLLLLTVSVQLARKPSGSSYSFAPQGARAFFLLLREMGVQVEPWLHPFDRLDPNDRGRTMLLVAVPKISNTKPLLEWVRKGNRLVLFGEPGSGRDGLYKALELTEDGTLVEQVRGLSETAVALECEAQAPAACRSVKQISNPGRLSVNAMPDNVVAGSAESPVILRLSEGEGEVWLVAGASPLLNRNIDKHDNLRFAYQLLTSAHPAGEGDGEHIVLFDEFHHGYTAPVEAEHRSRFESLLLLLGVLTTIMIVGALSRAVRFGPPIRPAFDDVSGRLEFATAMGILCQEHQAYPVLRHYLHAWKSRAEERFRLPTRAGIAEQLPLLTEHSGLSDERRKELQAAVTDLAKPEGRDAEKAHAVRVLEEFLEMKRV